MSLRIRSAADADIPALVHLINAAFEVELFFKGNDRTGADELRAMLGKGAILIGEDEQGNLAACVYVEQRGDRGYFGMLSVDPAKLRRGYGREMVGVVEDRFRAAGCSAVDMRVVNLRTELPGIYWKLGYEVQGTEPFDDKELLLPAHFVLWSKSLRANSN